ncbi:MAG: GntR family transcriptional regulator [Vulcanimicrobiaceae bacterium]
MATLPEDGVAYEAVAKRTLGVVAAERLREAIITGRTSPGERLVEAVLATQLDLSRGTVRAALHQLASEGLVIQRPYSRWQVVNVTAHDAWELYILRSRLEALAAGLAAERSNSQGRARLKAAFERLRDAVHTQDPRGISNADFDLHKTIVSLSEHSRLMTEFAHVEGQVRMYIASTNALISVDRSVIENHAKLVQPVLAGDVATAESIASRHSLVAGYNLVKYLEHKREHVAQSCSCSRAEPRVIVSDSDLESFVYRWSGR